MPSLAFTPNFATIDLLLKPELPLLSVSDEVQQTLDRLYGWDTNAQIWRPVLVDSNGALFGSIALTKSNSAVSSAFSVGTTAAIILAANPARKACTFFNNGPGIVYLGFNNAVTTTTGYSIPVGGTYADNLFIGSFWAIAGAAGNDVRIIEES